MTRLSRKDRLERHMAEGCPSVAEAARRMKLTAVEAQQIWKRINRSILADRMKPATQQQIKEAVATRTAMQAHYYLFSIGLRATPQHCKVVKDDARFVFNGSFAS